MRQHEARAKRIWSTSRGRTLSELGKCMVKMVLKGINLSTDLAGGQVVVFVVDFGDFGNIT